MKNSKNIQILKLNIDVASSTARDAKSLHKLPNLIYVTSVQNGIDKIIKHLNSQKKPGRIWRLRFFGHGCVIGNKDMAGILLGPLVGDGSANAIATSNANFYGREQLLRLKPFIRIYSSLEFHQCNPPGDVGEREVKRFARMIADLLDTQVLAGVGNQATGETSLDRFEGGRVRADGRGGKKPLLDFQKMEE
jgi:hypothetical protein